MDSNDLRKLDTLPTSSKPWYTRTPFWGIILFAIILIVRAVMNWLGLN